MDLWKEVNGNIKGKGEEDMRVNGSRESHSC